MKVTKKELDKARVELTIEVSDERFKEALDKAFQEKKVKSMYLVLEKGMPQKL